MKAVGFLVAVGWLLPALAFAQGVVPGMSPPGSPAGLAATVQGNPNGIPLGTSDPSNLAIHMARVLTPSGTAGTAGTIAGLPYPSTASGTVASATNTGNSFGYVCPTAGVGSITLADGSVLPYTFSSAGSFSRDDYAIIDAEPPSGVTCVFSVLH